MARAPTMEEAIRLVLETQGREGVEQLGEALAGVGDVSAETRAQTEELMDSINQLNDTADGAARFERLSQEIAGTEEHLSAASRAALQLSLQLAATEKPSRELIATQKAARDEVERLEQAVARQYRALEAADAELGSLGVNTADLTGEQARLRSEIVRTASALERQGQALRQEAEGRARLAQQLADGDEQFRRFARSGRASAEALAAYRQRAQSARDATDDLADAGRGVTGIFQRLSPLLAGVFGFFSVRGIIDGFKSIVREGSQAEQELGQLQAVLASTGREAEFAGEELQKLAGDLARSSRFSAGEIINAETRLLSYTNILRAEFPQAMQIVLDQSARLNMSLEQSAEVVGRALQSPARAMEALGRQGFVLEDSQKRLLAQLEATGQTARAQAIIMDLLVESYGGAAAAQKLGRISGLWKALQETFRDFQTDVANRGVIDYFKQQLTDLLATLSRMGRDGSLAAWAQRVADGIVRVSEQAKALLLQLRPLGQMIAGTTQLMVNHAGTLVLLAKAYAGLKLVQVATWFAAVARQSLAAAAGTDALTGATTRQTRAAQALGGVLRSLPKNLVIGLSVLGVDWAIRQMAELHRVIQDRRAAARQQEDYDRSQRDLQREQLLLGRQLQQLYRQNAGVAIKSTEDLNALTRDQASAYRYALNEASQYWAGMVREARATGDAVAEAAAHERWQDLSRALASVDDQLARGGISAGARHVATELNGIAGNARLATEQIGKLFDGIELTDTAAVGDLAAGLAEVARRGEESARAMEQGLRQSLAKLSGEDLLRFQTASQAAFAGFDELPRGAAQVIDATLLTAMQRLGVSASRLGFQFTEAGEDAIASFTAVAQNANASAAQVEAAFRAALDRATTVEEVQRLGEVLAQVGGKGQLGFQQAERAGVALENRIRQIKNALDPLNDSFSELGIRSQADLNRARDAARSAFDQIVRGAREGTATIEDQRRAFQAYAQAARAAAAESDASARMRVEAELQVLDAVHGVSRALNGAGAAGESAGDRMASGAAVAEQGLRRLAGTARDTAAEASAAAAAVGDTADAIASAGQASVTGAGQANGFAAALGGLSEQAVRTLTELNRFAGTSMWNDEWNNVMANVRGQREALERRTQEIQRQTAAMDPLARKVETLRKEFGLLDESAVQGLAQQEMQLEQRVEAQRQEAERAAAEARRARDERAKAAAERANAAAEETAEVVEAANALERAGSRPIEVRRHERLEVLLRADQSTARGLGLSQGELSQLARDLTPLVVRELELSSMGRR